VVNDDVPVITTSEAYDHCAAVQTKAMVAKKSKPPKPLKINSVPGLEIGPNELLAALGKLMKP